MIEKAISEKAKATFKSISVVFWALVAGQVLFAAVSAYLTQEKAIDTITADDPMYLYIGGGILLLCIVGQYFYASNFNVPGPSIPLDEKTESYRSLHIVQWAILETAILVNIVFFLLSAKLSFLSIAFAGLLYFLTLRPSVSDFSKRFVLHQQEKEVLTG